MKVLNFLLFGFFALLLTSCAVPTGAPGSSTKGGDLYAGNGQADSGYGSAVASGAGNSANFNGSNSIYGADGKLIKQNTIYFTYDSNAIQPWALQPINANLAHEMNPHPTSKNVLNAYAAYLENHPNARIRLEGNTDARGTREYNIALGERRADSVADTLKLDGVPANQISVISYGKEKPVALGNSESAYSKNRRVNLILEG